MTFCLLRIVHLATRIFALINQFSSVIFLFFYSCVVFVPVDVVKERLQVQVSASTSNAGRTLESSKLAPPVYKGSLDALIQICRQEGLTGIYKGYGATLLSYGPFSALYFFLYEEVKKVFLQ